MSNEKYSRKSRFSDKEYENSSVYNRSVKSQLTSLSIDLPKNKRKYTNIEKELIQKQNKVMPITINLTNTKYPIFLQVCGQDGFNWRIQTFSESKVWNLKWYDTGVTNQILQRMTHQQKINTFSQYEHHCKKKFTCDYTCQDERYDFMPRTFLYPNDYAKIRHYFVESRKRGLVKTFIVKPEAGCQGRGIYITQNPADFQKEQKCVIQKYISNPLLHQGLKFDLRIYVLVASCNPLRIYLYNEGLVRFATQVYELPDSKNLNNFYIHLTNYAINKSHPNYEYNYTVKDMSYGHKKSLAEFFRSLKEMGFKANLYWSQIKDHIIKTMIAAQPFLVANYKICRPQQSSFGMCFEVLGFDFLIDNQNRCFLLQVNHTPSFSTDTPLDHIIKKNLLKDTLLMMSSCQEEINIKQKLQRLKQRQKYVKFKNNADNPSTEREQLLRELNEVRIKHELQFKGTYEMIYPTTTQAKMEKYKNYIIFATKVLQQNLYTSSNSIPSSSDIRNRLKDNSKAKVVSKQIIKQNISKNVTESLNKKKNLIYNYNYIKKDRDSSQKRTLMTLPAEPYRIQVHPKQKFVSSRVVRINSKDKLKGPVAIRDIKSGDEKVNRYGRSEQKLTINEFVNSKTKQMSQRVHSQQKIPTREINNFSNRIRAYKTPLMF